MFDMDFEWEPRAAGIAALVELIYIASATQAGMGWDTFPLWIKLSLGVIIPPVMYLVAVKMLNR